MCRDIAPEGDDLKETNANLDQLTDLALELQQKTGVKLLWATCNLFSNPRYLKLFFVILFTPWCRCSWAQFSILTAPSLTLSRKCGISGGSGDLQWTSDSNTDLIGQRSQDKPQQ